MTVETRKRLGEFFILLIYLFMDGYDLWPHSHFLALSGGLLGFMALLLLDGGFDEQKIFIYSLVVLICCVIVFYAAPPIAAPEPWRGWLQAANEPTPPNPCNRFGIKHEVTVLLGGSVFSVTKDFLATTHDKFVPLSICGKPAFTVERGPNGIRINATVHDTSGRSVGRIVNNTYVISKDNGSFVEHSGDLSTLEVQNSEGNELFYIRYLNPRLMRVRGVFTCHPGQPVIIVNDSAISTTGRIVLSSGGIIGPVQLNGYCSEDNRTGIAIGGG